MLFCNVECNRFVQQILHKIVPYSRHYIYVTIIETYIYIRYEYLHIDSISYYAAADKVQRRMHYSYI